MCLHICECSVYVFAHLCICIFVCMDVECVYMCAFTHAHMQRLVISGCYPCLLFTPYYFFIFKDLLFRLYVSVYLWGVCP